MFNLYSVFLTFPAPSQFIDYLLTIYWPHYSNLRDGPGCLTEMRQWDPLLWTSIFSVIFYSHGTERFINSIRTFIHAKNGHKALIMVSIYKWTLGSSLQ